MSVSSAIGLSLFWSTASLAQETANTTQSTEQEPIGPAEDPQEIIVTATKRTENVQDVPSAVQVIDNETLERINAVELRDVVNKMAGVSGFSTGNGVNSFIVRGISPIGGGALGSSVVGYYLDETPLSAGGITPDVALFDLERIEVLRGPQGTLYGEGSLSGTIRLITQKPDLNNVEGQALGLLAPVKDGGTDYRGSGAVSVPIIPDVLAVRATGTYLRNSGFVDDLISGRKDVNDTKTTNGRVAVLFRPVRTLDLLASYQRQETKGEANAIENPTLPRRRSFQQAFPQVFKDRFNLYNLTANLDLGSVSLVSSSSYYDRRRTSIRDARELNATFIAIFGPIPQGIRESNDFREDSFIQEVRLISDETSRFRYVLGGYYKTRDIAQEIPVIAPDIIPIYPPFLPRLDVPGRTFNASVDGTFLEIAGFGEVEFDLLDNLTLTGGARIFKQKIDVDSELFNLGNAFAGLPLLQAKPFKTKNNDVLFKAAVDYEFTRDILLYGLFSQGIRGGNINTRAFGANDPSGFGPDSTDNYEIGLKTQFANRKITANLALFKIKYKDIQTVVEVTVGNSFVVNGGSATSNGIELELSARPTSNVEIGGTYTYLDSTTDEVFLLAGGSTPRTTDDIFAAEGTKLPNTPRNKFNVFADYRRPITASIGGFARADLEFVGKRENRLRTNQPAAAGSSFITFNDYTLVNLRAGLDSERYTLSAFVDNVFDRTAQFAADFPLTVGIAVNRPRRMGISAQVRF